MTQLDLWSSVPARARRADPVTSHEAAAQMLESGAIGRQAQEVMSAVERWPGLTSLELGARLEIDRWAVARRLPELEAAGRVRRGEPRLIGARRHLTWWPA